jgi:hypothetical protein
MSEKSSKRTSQQNKALHVWFKETASECLDNGVTVDAILKHAIDMQVDEGFIKWLFRRIATKKYGHKSTADVEDNQINPILDDMRLFFAHKVEPTIELPPFPDKSIQQYETYSN